MSASSKIFPLVVSILFFFFQPACKADSTGLPPVAGRVKVAVSDPARREAVQRLPGARMVADYDSFTLFELDAAKADEMGGQAGVTRRPEFDWVELNAGRLKTGSGGASERRSSPPSAFKGKKLHLLQFAGPVQPGWVEDLAAAGLEVVDYIPYNAYLVYGASDGVRRLRGRKVGRGPVQWEGDYLPEYKLPPGPGDASGGREKAGGTREPDAYVVQMVLDPPANAETRRLIGRLGPAPGGGEIAVRHYVNVYSRLRRDALPAISRRPDVISIHEWYRPEPSCERQGQIVAGHIVQQDDKWKVSGPGYLEWLAGLGFAQEQFAASGFSVDVVDSGIDNFTSKPSHPGLYVSGDTAKPGRVAYQKIFGDTGSSEGRGCDGHGNINAHIVAGYSDSQDGHPYQDAEGYHPGLGICPFVAVGSSVIFDPGFTGGYGDLNFTEIMSHAYSSGSRISTNSWGRETFAVYSALDQIYDMAVRDASPDAPGNQQMVVCVASGNHGSGSNTVLAPAAAKNVIAVGASRNVNPFGGTSGNLTRCSNDNDTYADDASAMAPFSNEGPCADGRVKPDIVAPGTHVSGGLFQADAAPPTGKANPCFNFAGVCGGPGPDYFWPLGQELYTASSGTSHSCPAVAGGAALVRQHFLNAGAQAPSPAMTKAFLANSARFLTGVGPGEKLPSNSQGMGLMDLGRAFDGTPSILREESVANTFTASGQTRVIKGRVADTSKPFRVTLAWTDAPGSTTGDAFKNDLDLTVITGGRTYHGNVFQGGTSVPDGGPDPRNNLESVFLPAGTAGPFVVLVDASNVNSAAVPGGPGTVNQDFALVVYNCVETPAPQYQVTSLALVAEGCSPANGSADPAETVTYEITVQNVGSLGASDLIAKLPSQDGIRSPRTPVRLGPLAPGAAATGAFTFNVAPDAPCGDRLDLILTLFDGPKNAWATFTLPVGLPVDGPHRTAGTGAIAVVVPEDGGEVEIPIEVGGTGETVDSVRPMVRIDHPVALNLALTLVSPDGRSVLLSQWKGRGPNFGSGTGCDGRPTVFDDDAENGLSEASSPFAGTFKPDEPLSAISGAPVDGVWKLRVANGSSESAGLVQCFQLDISPRQFYCCGQPGTPAIAPDSAALLSEGCRPENGAADPGERVTVRLSLRNEGTAPAYDLSAELLPGQGVTDPGGPKIYGLLTPGMGGASGEFSFTVDPAWPCGQDLSLRLRLRDGGADLGEAAFQFPTGVREVLLAENFDGARPPALPEGWWAGSGAEGQASWTTTDYRSETAPNSAWVGDNARQSDFFLVSPPVLLNAPAAQMSFVVWYGFLHDYRNIDDGAVLEVSLDGGAFQDVVAAGGVFEEGGYNGVVDSFTNPLYMREAWTRSTDRFVPVVLDLPESWCGRTAVFRFRVGCSGGNFIPQPGGMFLDDILLTGRPVCCGNAPPCRIESCEATGTPETGPPPVEVSFRCALQTSDCAGPPHYVWNFGDGTPVEFGESVRHTYTALGDYTWHMSAVVDGQVVSRSGVVRVRSAVVNGDGGTLVAEGCTPPNQAIDPGEAVTVDLKLKNVGNQATADLVAELLPTGGISSPGPPQRYGVIQPGDPSEGRPFTFTGDPGLACGGELTATLRLTDGARNLGEVSFAFRLGGGETKTLFFEPFSPSGLDGWAIENVRGSSCTWRVATGADEPPCQPHSPPAMAVFVSSTGVVEEDEVRLQQVAGIDLRGVRVGGAVTLTYWIYCPKGAFMEFVLPQASTDGGLTWVAVGSPAAWHCENSGEWMKETLDISEFRGQADVRLGFLGLCYAQVDTYIDDISVEAEVPVCCRSAGR